MFFENQYQLAYVTANLEQGVEVLQAQYGVSEFKSLGGGEVVSNRVWTPTDSDAEIVMKAAIAQVGGLTLEVLQPVSGATDIFQQMLTPDQPLRLHHLGMRCQDLDAMRVESERLGRSVVMAGGFKTARFIYVDARATLGHFLEYASAPPEYWNR